jgi:hypothetical protein
MHNFMTRTIIKTLLAASALVLVGAGCMDRFKPAEQPPVTEMRKTIQEAFESTTSTLEAVATSTTPSGTLIAPASVTTTLVAPPKVLVKWDVTGIPAAGVTFTPPAGYWVFNSNDRGQHYLVPGKAPAPGSANPSENAVKTAVAVFNILQRDSYSFPTWDRFELTMGEFACSDGNSPETLIECSDKMSNELRGKTNSGLSFHKFTLPAAKNIDNSPQGTRTYIMVRLGAASDNGLFVNVTDPAKGSTPALALVRSIKVK